MAVKPDENFSQPPDPIVVWSMKLRTVAELWPTIP
jgi:hypothetical protein